MLRSVLISVLMLAVVQVAVAQSPGDVVSYFFGGTTGVIVEDLPADGFILTDVVVVHPGNGLYFFYEGLPKESNKKLGMDLSDAMSLHLRNGVPFAGGAQLSISSPDFTELTIFGYVPQSVMAQSPGDVVSYFYEGAAGVVVDSFPADGFVLTDVILATPVSGLLFFYEGQPPPTGIKKFGIDMDDAGSLHLQSGIPFTGGAQMSIGFPFTVDFTVTGYVPSKAVGNVPAISGIGMAIMLLFIVAVGGFVFKRVKMQDVESC